MNTCLVKMWRALYICCNIFICSIFSCPHTFMYLLLALLLLWWPASFFCGGDLVLTWNILICSFVAPQPASLKDITEESPSTSRQPAVPRYLLKVQMPNRTLGPHLYRQVSRLCLAVIMQVSWLCLGSCSAAPFGITNFNNIQNVML